MLLTQVQAQKTTSQWRGALKVKMAHGYIMMSLLLGLSLYIRGQYTNVSTQPRGGKA
jgi:hypothetical protein